MNREDALTAIEQSSLCKYQQELAQYLLPSARIRTRPIDADESAASRFLGAPLLPTGVEWPQWDAGPYFESTASRWEQRIANNPRHTGSATKQLIDQMRQRATRGIRPLSFIGQTDLAAISCSAGLSELPNDGILSFFYDTENCPGAFDPLARGCGRVIYAKGSSAVEARPPVSLPGEQEFPPRSLDFEEEWTLPDYFIPSPQGVLRQLLSTKNVGFGIWQNQEYRKLYEQLIGPLEGSPIHRVGGHPQQVQGDMRIECQLASSGVYCGGPEDYKTQHALDLRKGSADWLLLLQVDSDETLGWMWGDAGRLYFWIRRQDLQQCDFSNIWAVMQCY